MVAAIVAREFLVSGLRLAAVERGVVISARDLGKLKTWAQAVAAAVGGFAAAGAWDQTVAWWALLVAVVLTWVSGLDYARVAPGLLRGRAPRLGTASKRSVPSGSTTSRTPAAHHSACLGLAVELGKRLQDRLALLRGRLRPDLDAHGRLSLKEHGAVGRWRRG